LPPRHDALEEGMTLQRLKKTAAAGFASTGMAVALMLGFGPAIAHADVLDDVAGEYASGAGGGQVSNLVVQSIKLRNMGFKPTQSQLAKITDALNQRPNQTPLVHALQDTIAAQNRLKSEAQAAQGGQNPVSIGINQYDPNSPGGVTAGPGGINLGGGSNQWTIGDGNAPGQSVGPPR
jgi:hypothetical protein